MDFADGVANYGDAPIYSVDGIASVEKISPHKIRVTYFAQQKLRGNRVEKKAVLQIDWDASVWIKTRAAISLGVPAIVGNVINFESRK